MRKIILPLVFFALVLTACQKVVDADNLLDTEERVSIIGYLSPSNELIQIAVTKAIPAIGTALPINDTEATREQFAIKDALVTLSSEENNVAILPYSEATNFYEIEASDFPIESGRRYFLKVTANGNEYNASCKIPEKVPLLQETINEGQDEFGSPIFSVNISFQDFDTPNDFYIVNGNTEVTFQLEDQEPQTSMNELIFDPDEFLTDNTNNGGVLGRKAEVAQSFGENILETTLTLRVAHAEEVLYQNLRATNSNAENGGNPFVEFSVAPNNILDRGAFGVFAGYVITEKKVRLNN